MVDRVRRRNVWVCEVGKQNPNLIPLITLDPVMAGDEMRQEIFDKVLHHGAKGLKLHPPIGRYYPNDPAMWPAYQACVDLDVPILFHCGPHPKFEGQSLLPEPVEYARPKHYEDVLSAFPKLRVVLAHMGVGPDNRFPSLYQIYYQESLAVAKKYPTLCMDTCAALDPRWSPGPPEDWAAMIREVGPERVLFGSDCPAFDPAVDLERVRSLRLTEAERRLILGENAMRVFKIA